MFWEKLCSLCSERNTTPTKLVTELGLSRGSVTNWKQGKIPHYQTLQKLADYFGVSVDYLLGKTKQKEKPSPEGESFEEDVVIVHRDGKAIVRRYTKEQLDAIEAILNQIGDSKS